MKYIYALLFVGLFTIKGQSQNVGIGTTTPTYPLTVQGTSQGKSITTKNGAVEVGFYNNGVSAVIQTWSDHDLSFATGNGAPKLTLDFASGNVGINTRTPTAQLDINGTLRLRNNGAAVGAVLTSDADGNATWQKQVQTGIYSVDCMEFKPEDNNTNIKFRGGNGGAYVLSAITSELYAPVHLPNGAKVTKITYGFSDNTADDFTFTFGSQRALSYSVLQEFQVMSSGANGDYRTVVYIPTTPIIIYNNTLSYYVIAKAKWSGDEKMVVKGVVIEYTL